MLYAAQELAYHAAQPARLAARLTKEFWDSPLNPAGQSPLGRTLSASAKLYDDLTRRYGRPDWNIDHVMINGERVRVRMVTVWRSPWARLLHFTRDYGDLRKAGKRGLEPPVLIAAPMSGHYATLLRGTVEAFLQDHEVFVTDWRNAREVPVMEGRFDLHDYIDHVREMLRRSGRALTSWPSASRAAGAGRGHADGGGRRGGSAGLHDLHGFAHRRAARADGDQPVAESGRSAGSSAT
jgi:poly(3-hydroxybutyrate) depolymerase